MFNPPCPKYLPAASCRKPADGSDFSVDGGEQAEEPEPSVGHMAYLHGGDPRCVLHNPTVIYEPAKVSFCGKGAGATCLMRLK